MFNNTRIFFVTVIALLVGCTEQDVSIDYLMANPAQFQADIQQCQSMSSDVIASPRCQKLSALQRTLSPYFAAQQADPEKFGEYILETEMACAAAQAKKCEEVKILMVVASLGGSP